MIIQSHLSQLTASAKTTSRSVDATADSKNSETDVSSDGRITPSIAHLNSQLEQLSKKSSSDQSMKALEKVREQAISNLTGNSNTHHYDPLVAAVAERDGIRYNKAVDNINTTNNKFDASGSSVSETTHEYAETMGGVGKSEFKEFVSVFALLLKVESVPWEVEPLNTRINELMFEENLSSDAATVIVMTESGTEGVDQSSKPAFDESWREDFARMATKAAPEIAAWAESKNTGAITFVPGDNDIRVSQRADGMLVVTSSLNGVAQGSPQIIDPSATDRVVINAGSGNDTITVDPNVTKNLLLAGGDGADFIYGGGGNDIIIGGEGDDLVRAGSGNDIVLGGNGNDNLEGEDGADILLGQAGDDYQSGGNGSDLSFGGVGQDSLYGGNGKDILNGESGNDYLDAGSGNDLAIGGVGDDVISGGKGNDIVRGNAGADTLIGASGADSYSSVDARDTVIVDSQIAADAIRARVPGANVRLVDYDENAGKHAVSISAGQREEFITRTQDDLETFRSLRSGQAMLNALDDAKRASAKSDRHILGINVGGSHPGHGVMLTELDGKNYIDYLRNPTHENRSNNTERAAFKPTGGRWTTTDPVNHPAPGSGTLIRYNPSVNIELQTDIATPPAVILFHELAHAYNAATGTGLAGKYGGVDSNNNNVDGRGEDVRNIERQAVGLEVDHDNDPTTPEQRIDESVHPLDLTENGIRTELNLKLRPYY